MMNGLIMQVKMMNGIVMKMNKLKYEIGDRIWDEQIGDYREDKNYHLEFNDRGYVHCPCCDTTIYKEDETHKLIYCDTCGYDF